MSAFTGSSSQPTHAKISFAPQVGIPCLFMRGGTSKGPFFKAADYGIVGDAFDVVPKLTEEIKKLHSA